MKRSGARPRLCMIVHATYPQDVRVAREARLAVEHGFDVDVVALRDPGELKVENVGGVRVFRLPVTHRRGVGVVGVFREYLGYAALASVRAFWLALKRPYDVVQVHNPPDFLIVASILPRLLGARVILDIHDLSPDMFAMRFAGRPGANLADNTLKWLERWSARLADVVITVHEPYRRELVARSVPREKTAVVMNSLDEALIPQGDEPAPHDGFRVVYHGTITPPYGVQLIVEAAALVRGRIDDIQVEIYGAGDSLPGIRERADELGISEAVILSGRYLGQSEVLTRVRGADVGVIPNLATRLNKFALSSKLFEYVVLSIPVVCADLPTIREHFSDDEVLFFTAGDAVSLARALEAVASDPAAAAARAARALARYRKEYTWATSGEEYVGVLKRLTAPGRTQERGARYVGPPRYDHDRLAPVIAEPAQGGGAVFGSTEPFLFAEHFRIPSRHASLAELDPELEARDPLRRLGQLRWVGRDGKTSPRKLVWPSRANPSSSAIPLAEVRLDESPFYARVVPDGVAARWLGEGWNPTAPVTDRTGQRVASIWRDGDGSIFLPFDPSEVIVNYWSEAYRSISGRRVGRLAWRIGRPFYYRLRPALPRAGQIRIRQLLSRVQTRSTFPRWPVETSLNDFYGRVFGWLGELADEPIPWISPWPDGHDWALVLTHDVETADGYQRVAGVCDVERSLGYRSSWNFVPRRYAVADDVVSGLLADGFEVGVHGLHHDGRDFESLATLQQRLPEMRRYADRWHATGFRSPSTHRVWDWMPLLDFDYDSSFPDTDPFEPYSGGCCSWLPFFNDHLVELPITLPQDHTLFAILGHPDESLWVEKIAYLRDRGAMALLITHPDYMVDERLAEAYGRLLERLSDDETVWRALPREVSGWWRRRAASTLEPSGEGWKVVGPAEDEATISFSSPAPPLRDLPELEPDSIG